MNYSGEIKLYNGKILLHSFKYFSREERKLIIERWKQAYPHILHAFDIHICPNVFQGRPRTRLDKMQEESKERYEKPPIIRPAAKYDNLPIYNYDK